MKIQAYIHSLKDHEHNRHVMGEAEIIRQIGDNLYLAEVNGVRCTAILPEQNRTLAEKCRGHFFGLAARQLDLRRGIRYGSVPLCAGPGLFL